MAKNKTTETKANVLTFLKSVQDEQRRKDSIALCKLMTDHLDLEPKMWGSSIVGFGSYHYRYDSGHEGDAPLVAFSPRASAIVLYFAVGFEKRESLLEKLGKHKSGKGCIYIKTLKDIDPSVLLKLAAESIKHLKKLYPG